MSGKPSILIVDDQVDNQKFLVNFLKPDYRVLVAADGAAALDLLRAASAAPDLILLDIMMPVMDGYETCRHIKNFPHLAQTPIIFLTAKSDPDSETRGFELGASDYVTKPINPPVLRARIIAQLALAEQMRRAYAERDRSQHLVAQVSRERNEIEALARRLEAEIAERERTEAALRTLSQAVEQAPLSIVITDAKGSIVYVNPHFSLITGYSREEAIGQNPRLLKSGEQNETTYKALWETIASGRIWRGELINKNKQGQLFWESVVISPILDERGEVTHYVAVKEDIGDRKELERIKEDVQHIMRHDLKAPLNAVIALPGLILTDETLSEKTRKYIGMILDSGQQMYDMIELSLDLFKMETGHYEYVAQSIDVLPILRRLVAFTESRLSDKRLEVAIRLDGTTCPEGAELWVCADDRLLFSLLSNLFLNAIEASPDGETIRIELRCAETVVLTLRNRGTVPEAIRAHFFEKYRTQGKRGGTGLGTYSAKLMADTMGLELGMETSDDQDWTCLRLTLPVRC